MRSLIVVIVIVLVICSVTSEGLAARLHELKRERERQKIVLFLAWRKKW